MARHGGGRHLKAIAAPRVLGIARKEKKFLKKAVAGPHSLAESVPLLVLVRDYLKLGSDAREARQLLKDGKILVDGRVVKNEGFPVGLMDVVAVPATNSFYRVLLSKKKIFLKPIPATQSVFKYCKVVGKRICAEGRVQLVFHDGRTLVIEREEARFGIGDSIKLGIPRQEIKGFLKFEKNCLCYVSHGKHSGEIARLHETLAHNNARLQAQGEGKGELVTLKDYLFVVDEDFSVA